MVLTYSFEGSQSLRVRSKGEPLGVCGSKVSQFLLKISIMKFKKGINWLKSISKLTLISRTSINPSVILPGQI